MKGLRVFSSVGLRVFSSVGLRVLTKVGFNVRGATVGFRVASTATLESADCRCLRFKVFVFGLEAVDFADATRRATPDRDNINAITAMSCLCFVSELARGSDICCSLIYFSSIPALEFGTRRKVNSANRITNKLLLNLQLFTITYILPSKQMQGRHSKSVIYGGCHMTRVAWPPAQVMDYHRLTVMDRRCGF